MPFFPLDLVFLDSSIMSTISDIDKKNVAADSEQTSLYDEDELQMVIALAR